MENAIIDDYVVIDLEMTGLKIKKDRILEVGAVRVRDGVMQEEYEALINPGCSLSAEVIKLTGITDEMAKEGRDAAEVMEEFFSFLGEDVLVGQNIIYDYSFLKQWAVNHDRTFERNAVDTLKLARIFLPPEQKKDLASLCACFDIRRENAHRALADARETAQLFEEIKADFGEVNQEVFRPRPLQVKVKKQSPATERQKKYIKNYALHYGIELEEDLDTLSKSEASRLADQLLARYGKLTIEKTD